jgi:eukaryotic-like serine/threonine-protein kinase
VSSPPQLYGNYELCEEIHRGLAASVHRGSDREGGQPVAIKIFREHYSADPRFVIRFREHLRRLAGLTHENLVALSDYGVSEGRYYIVTEWVEGVDLGTYLAEHGALSPWWAATIARQACAALGAVHRAGLVHRGIKSQNILLTAEGRVKLSDVGMSGLISETGLSRTNVMLGSVGYISPEQARAQPALPASDIYSLGVVLFEMLTGRLPFVTSDAWSLVRLHAEGVAPSPKAFNPGLPDDLIEVARRALRKTPERRFASAGEMEAALAGVLVGGSLSPVEGSAMNGMGTGPGWMRFLRELATPRALKRLLTYPVRLPLVGWSLPFGVILLLQFLGSFLVALAFLYGLRLLTLRLF